MVGRRVEKLYLDKFGGKEAGLGERVKTDRGAVSSSAPY